MWLGAKATAGAVWAPVDAALPYVQVAASQIALAAELCTAAGSETVVLGLTCGTISTLASAVSAGSAIILHAEGKFSTFDTVLAVGGAGFSYASDLARVGAASAWSHAGSARVMGWLYAADAELSPGLAIEQPWMWMHLSMSDAEYWANTASRLDQLEARLGNTSLAIDLGEKARQLLEVASHAAPVGQGISDGPLPGAKSINGDAALACIFTFGSSLHRLADLGSSRASRARDWTSPRGSVNRGDESDRQASRALDAASLSGYDRWFSRHGRGDLRFVSDDQLQQEKAQIVPFPPALSRQRPDGTGEV